MARFKIQLAAKVSQIKLVLKFGCPLFMNKNVVSKRYVTHKYKIIFYFNTTFATYYKDNARLLFVDTKVGAL